MKLIVIGSLAIKLQPSRSAPQIDIDAEFKVPRSAGQKRPFKRLRANLEPGHSGGRGDGICDEGR